MFAAHVVVLHQNEAVGINLLPAELDVAPLQGHEFAAAESSAHRHQEKGVVLRADLLGRVQELLNFLRCKRDALGLSSLCRACEASQPGRRIGFQESLFNCLIEQSADDAQRVADGIPRKLLADQVASKRLDIVAPYFVQPSLSESGSEVLSQDIFIAVCGRSLAFDASVVLKPAIRIWPRPN